MKKKYHHFYIDPGYPRSNGALDVPTWPRSAGSLSGRNNHVITPGRLVRSKTLESAGINRRGARGGADLLLQGPWLFVGPQRNAADFKQQKSALHLLLAFRLSDRGSRGMELQGREH